MITKDEIAKLLGYKIESFDPSPVIVDGKIVGLSIRVLPKKTLEYINVTFTIPPTGVPFEDV